ncbi:MAG: hypothetical protein ACRBB0_01380 [Pelagimonas sp.]|uniref:hypothetical protein n=1 Tax=Pelagimonas sp. TaxID=2073170 RepID=UPI003D6C26D8
MTNTTALKTLLAKVEAGEMPYYVMEMPLTSDGNGPAVVGKGASKMTYEIWCARSLRTMAVYDMLSDANRECLSVNIKALIAEGEDQ